MSPQSLVRVQSVGLYARPPRLATLFSAPTSNWMPYCVEALKDTMSIWGGWATVLIPETEVLSNAAAETLRQSDPDFILRWLPIGSDVKQIDASFYEEIIAHEAKILKEETGAATVDNQDIDEAVVSQPFYPRAKHNWSSILSHCNPFNSELDQTIVVRKAGRLDYRLTELHTTFPHMEPIPPHSIFLPDSPLVSLIISARFGQFSSRIEEILNAVGAPHNTVNGEETRIAACSALALTNDLKLHKPADLNMFGCGQYIYDLSFFRSNFYVIAGLEQEDFFLFHNLSRMGVSVTWVPIKDFRSLEGLEENEDLIYSALDAVSQMSYQHGQIDTGILLGSAFQTLNMSEFSEILRKKLHVSVGSSVALHIHNGKPVEETHFSFHSCNGITDRQLLYLKENDPLHAIVTPIPPMFQRASAFDFSWITEIVFDGHQYPRSNGLPDLLVQRPRVLAQSSRASRLGASYCCPNIGVVQPNLHLTTWNPWLRVPTDAEAIELFFSERNIECSISDKGRYHQIVCDLCGDFDSAVKLLKDDDVDRILMAFMHDDIEHSLVVRIAKRNFLSRRKISRIVGREKCESIIEKLLAVRILKRGYCLKCEYCRNSDWYSIDEVGNEFLCRRCYRAQALSRSNWRGPREPLWFYALDEVFYQFLLNHGFVPLFAVNVLKERHRGACSYVPEVDLVFQGANCEFDFIFSADTRIYAGEGKCSGSLGGKTKIQEERLLRQKCLHARQIGATHLVLATGRESWSERTKDLVEILGEQDVVIECLTNKQLALGSLT